MKTNGFDNGFENQYGRNPESTELQEAVEGRMMALQSYFFFRPWFYLVMALGVVGYSVLKVDDQRLAPLLVASSGIFHEMGLFVFAPSVDYRYSHYLVFSAIVSVLILAFSNAKTHRLSDSL